MSENQNSIISVRKILENVKRYWWVCLMTLSCAAFIVAGGTIKTYRINKAAEGVNTYIGSATLYLSSENEKDNRAYSSVLSGSELQDIVNEILAEHGLEEFNKGTDHLTIQSVSDSSAYGLTVISIGEERTSVLTQAVIDGMLEIAGNVMGVKSQLLSEPYVRPCLYFSDGSFQTVSSESARIVQLSASDFLSWRKIMVLCAGFFAGIAVIFVMILFDERIWGEEELASLFPESACFGTVDKKAKGGDELPAALLLRQLSGQNAQRLCLITLGDKMAAESVRSMLEGRTEREVILTENVLQNELSVKKLQEAECAVMIIRSGKDTVGQVKKVLNCLQLFGVKMIGMILVK